MNTTLVVRAWAELLYADLVVLLRGFGAVRQIVGHKSASDSPDVSQVPAVLDAVGKATVLYVKPVMCLQRSVVVTRLLRQRGVAAELVIGCHLAPMRAHAWVEVNGDIVVEQIEGMKHYRILDRW